MGLGPSLQFGEAQRKFGGCTTRHRLSKVAVTTCQQLPQMRTSSLEAVFTAQHKHSSFLAFRRPAHVQAVFFILVIRDLPSSARDSLMDPVRKGSMQSVTLAVPDILSIHFSYAVNG